MVKCKYTQHWHKVCMYVLIEAWCGSGTVNVEACLRLWVCNVGLMSWTVCHPPTAVSEHTVIQRDSCISTQLPLFLAHRRTPPTFSPLQQEATQKTQEICHTHAHTKKTSQGIRPGKMRDENDFGVWTFLSSLFTTIRVCVFTCFSWQKMCIKDSPRAACNTLIMRTTPCACVINYLKALFEFLSEHCNSPNNKKQPIKSTYRAHILKTQRVPLHRLQL